MNLGLELELSARGLELELNVKELELELGARGLELKLSIPLPTRRWLSRCIVAWFWIR